MDKEDYFEEIFNQASAECDQVQELIDHMRDAFDVVKERYPDLISSVEHSEYLLYATLGSTNFKLHEQMYLEIESSHVIALSVNDPKIYTSLTAYKNGVNGAYIGGEVNAFKGYYVSLPDKLIVPFDKAKDVFDKMIRVIVRNEVFKTGLKQKQTP